MANLPYPLPANVNLTAPFFRQSVDFMRTVAYQTADHVINNLSSVTTPTQSLDLLLPVDEEGEYAFEACLLYDTSAAADIIFTINMPPMFVVYVSPWSNNTGITTVTNNVEQAVVSNTNGAQQFACGGVASGTVMCVRPAGYFKLDTGAGFINVQFTQATATAVNTILKQGSWIALTTLF